MLLILPVTEKLKANRQSKAPHYWYVAVIVYQLTEAGVNFTSLFIYGPSSNHWFTRNVLFFANYIYVLSKHFLTWFTCWFTHPAYEIDNCVK